LSYSWLLKESTKFFKYNIHIGYQLTKKFGRQFLLNDAIYRKDGWKVFEIVDTSA